MEKYFSYSEASEYIKKLNLDVKSLRELNAYLSKNKEIISKRLPKRPSEYYSETTKHGHGGWISFTDFTGIKNRRHVFKYKMDKVSVDDRKKIFLNFYPDKNKFKDFYVLKQIILENDQIQLRDIILKQKNKITRYVWGYLTKQDWFKKRDMFEYEDFFYDSIIDVTIAILNVKFTPEIIYKNPISWIVNSMKRTITFKIIEYTKSKFYSANTNIENFSDKNYDAF